MLVPTGFIYYLKQGLFGFVFKQTDHTLGNRDITCALRRNSAGFLGWLGFTPLASLMTRHITLGK